MVVQMVQIGANDAHWWKLVEIGANGVRGANSGANGDANGANLCK